MNSLGLFTGQKTLSSSSRRTGAKIELLPASLITTGGAKDLKASAGNRHPDVDRDFGQTPEWYASKSQRKIGSRLKKAGSITGQEVYAIRDLLLEKTIGVASITLAIPELRMPGVGNEAELNAYISDQETLAGLSLGSGNPALVATFWIGEPGTSKADTIASMARRKWNGQEIARLLTLRADEIAKAEDCTVVSFEVPLVKSKTSVSAGMRKYMTATGIIACWNKPVANPNEQYELLVGNQS